MPQHGYGEWAQLAHISCGILFETDGGKVAMKTAYKTAEGLFLCILFGSGEFQHFDNDVLVREILMPFDY